MSHPSTREDLEKLSVNELRTQAEKQKIGGFETMEKPELVRKLSEKKA